MFLVRIKTAVFKENTVFWAQKTLVYIMYTYSHVKCTSIKRVKSAHTKLLSYKYSDDDIIKMLEFVVDNIFVVFAG